MADLFAIARQSLRTLLGLLPYVIAGAAVSAALMRWRGKWLDRAMQFLSRLPLLPALALTSFIGACSPLCTLGTVPLIVGFLRFGLHPATAIAFLTTSSLINPQIFLIMTGTVGPLMAFVQLGLSLGIGIVAGLAAAAMGKAGWQPLRPGLLEEEKSGGSCTRHKRTFWQTFLKQLEFVLLYVVIGVILGSTVNVLIPGSTIQHFFHYARVTGVVAGTLASTPLYICGGGILPLLADLMEKGMPGGVVLAFITAGPATRFQSLAAIAVLLRNWSIALYVLLIWLCAFGAGMGWNLIFKGGG